jgi:tRNA (guanine37-N1)-methyltransferase
MKRFDVVTLFPEMFSALTKNGVTGRAENRGVYDLVCWNPREFADDSRRTVDDRPYGGGAGMILMPNPLAKAIDSAKKRQIGSGVQNSTTIYLSPQGRVLTQQLVEEISTYDGLILLSGRYEGIDERVIETRVNQEVSIGDYVLSGGELPAMVLLDAIIRWLTKATLRAHSNILNLPGLRFLKGIVYPRYYLVDIMHKLNNGEINKLLNEHV